MEQSCQFKQGDLLLDRYEIIGCLGSGGMAEVYQAHDHSTQQLCALKVVRADCAHHAALLARFRAEYSLLRELTHPRIVPVFDLHETPDGRPFFTLALLEGKPLESLISDYKLRSLSLSEEDIRSILDQVAEALHYLHQNRLVFCDLKPANIMVSEHAGMLSCTLIDFGIAQRLQTSETASTTRGNITGTSHYLSPEQVQGRHPDVRSDVYAFGVLGYELVTGAPPFTQRELFDATAAHLLAKIPALTTSHPSLSRALATMIELCLAKDPEDRFQSMLEIRERLARRPRLSFLQMIRAQWQRIITIPSRVQKRRSGRDSDDKPQIGESSTPS